MEKLEGLETKEETEMKYNDLKLSIQELGLKVIEFGSSQGNHADEIKEILGKDSQIKEEEEKEKEQRTIKKLKFKGKMPPSGSSSSSSSSDNEDNGPYLEPRRSIKSRILITPNTRTNDIDIEFLKKALLETENGEEFGLALEEKKYEFTKVRKMK
jgi:hypothetical protein